MDDSYEEKFALVTGGAKRLGTHLCKVLVECRYHLIIHHNNSEPEALELKNGLSKIDSSLNILSFKADLTKDTEVDLLIKFVETNFGKLNVLINNASIFSKLSFSSTDSIGIDQYLKIHVTAPLLLSKWMMDKNQSDEKIIINMLDDNRRNNVEKVINYGDYFMYSLSKHSQYLSNQYLVKEVESRNLSCKIFGLLLNFVLPNDLDKEYFLKNNISVDESQRKINKLYETLEIILRDEKDKKLASRNFQI